MIVAHCASLNAVMLQFIHFLNRSLRGIQTVISVREKAGRERGGDFKHFDPLLNRPSKKITKES